MSAPEQDPSELAEVAEDIEQARRQAEEHGTIPDSTPEPTFVDPDADGEMRDHPDDPGANIAPM
ncbi:MAG: hypothetical protein Q8K58_05060 [Acidimicrobiales bacterium]|nr:hypothetical protein [Acidimicrobiales bacterium]